MGGQVFWAAVHNSVSSSLPSMDQVIQNPLAAPPPPLSSHKKLSEGQSGRLTSLLMMSPGQLLSPGHTPKANIELLSQLTHPPTCQKSHRCDLCSVDSDILVRFSEEPINFGRLNVAYISVLLFFSIKISDDKNSQEMESLRQLWIKTMGVWGRSGTNGFRQLFHLLL